MITRTYEARVPDGVDASRPSIARIYDYLVEPGLVSLPEWRPDFNTDRTPLRGPTLGATARLAA